MGQKTAYKDTLMMGKQEETHPEQVSEGGAQGKTGMT